MSYFFYIVEYYSHYSINSPKRHYPINDIVILKKNLKKIT